MEINERIFYELDKQKKTSKELSQYVGVSAPSVTAWRAGSYPSAKYIPKIAEFLNVSISYLYTGDDESLQDRPDLEQVTIQEREILHLFRHLDDSAKLQAQRFIAFQLSNDEQNLPSSRHLKKTSKNGNETA